MKGMSSSRAQSASRFAWTVLAFNVVVILWGAFVRASGSGAGCGKHWPLCNGEVVPRAPRLETLIELTHRVTSGLALVLVIALVIWTWRVTAKRSGARRAAIAALILMLNEAWLGAMLVLLQRVAQDASAGRAVLLSLHFCNTLLLLASIALCARWLGREDQPAQSSAIRRKRLVIVGAGLAGIVLVGASGSIAALGDTLFPATSLRAALTADTSSVSNILLRLRIIHPALAIVTLVFVMWMMAHLRMPSPGRRGKSELQFGVAEAMLIFYFTQLMLGMVNVALLAPVWMQITHLFVAELFWISTVLAADEVLRARAEQAVATAIA